MDNVSKLSPVEVALKILEESNGPKNINEILNEVMTLKEVDLSDNEYRAKLYGDIVSSSKFVFVGEDMWDIKLRQPLEVFDQDGAAFTSKDDEYVEDVEDEIDLEDEDEEKDEYEEEEDEEELEDNDQEPNEYEEDEDGEYDDYENEEDYDESSDEDDFDEDKYNEAMDDYEDMYD